MIDNENKVVLPDNTNDIVDSKEKISNIRDIDESHSDESSSFHFTTSLDDVVSRTYREYVLHVFCVSGVARARYGDKVLELIPDSCLVLLNNGVFSWMEKTKDFAIRAVFISNDYMEKNSPDINYNAMGMLAMMDNPLVRMNSEQFQLCMNVCNAIKERVKEVGHLFYEGVLRRCVETLLLDLYNIRSKADEKVSTQGGNQGMRLFRKFISMLESGSFRTQREVRWYSGELKITAKYLSEVCMNASGHGASYWINRFTTEEIARLLHNPTMSIKSISELMNFTTKSYFSHYVKERLGMTPKDYRMMILGVKK